MDYRHLYAPGDNGGESVDDCLPRHSDLQYFDLESERLDFEHYTMFNTTSCSDTDSSVYDCSLDESVRQIKTDLDMLNSPRKTAAVDCLTTTSYCGKQSPGAATAVDAAADLVEDDFPDFDIDDRFDVMKDRVRNYRAKETEKIRRYIIDLNETLARVTDIEGKKKKKNVSIST